MQQWPGSDSPPIKEFTQMLTLVIALAKQESQTGKHMLEKSVSQVLQN